MGRGDERGTRRPRLPKGLRRPFRHRGGQRPFLGDDRRAAQKQFQPRRSFRQARRERPGLERAGETLPRRPRRLRRLLRQRDHRADERSVAWAGLSDHVAAQRRQSGRRGAGSPSRLSHGLPDGARDRALSDPRASPVADADASGRGRPLRHAARTPARRSTCRSRRPTCPAISRRPATTSAHISRPTRFSCRLSAATRSSSIPRSSTPRAPTAPRTSGGSPISCRSRRLTAARWKASTG